MAIKFKTFRHCSRGKNAGGESVGSGEAVVVVTADADGQAAPSDRDFHRRPQTGKTAVHFGAQKFSVVPCFTLQPTHHPKKKDTFFFKLYHFRTFYDLQLFGPSVLWSSNFSSISRPITKRPLGHSCILHPPHVTPPLPSATLNILHIIGFSQLLSICS